MIVPPPGSEKTEFGILRTFASERERDAFCASPLFLEWSKTMAVRGGRLDRAPVARDGSVFRGPQQPPARWKMALLTWLAVWPATVLVRAAFQPMLGSVLPPLVLAGIGTAGVVALLTWLVMPLYVKAARGWLQPPVQPMVGDEQRYGRK